MEEIKFSKKLTEKLGENVVGEITKLMDIDKIFNDAMNYSDCSPELKARIEEKMEKIRKVIDRIKQVNRQHRSNDEKKGKIEALQFNVTIEDVKAEISEVENLLKKKAIEIGKNSTKAIGERAKEVSDFFDSSIETEEERLNRLMNTPIEELYGTDLFDRFDAEEKAGLYDFDIEEETMAEVANDIEPVTEKETMAEVANDIEPVTEKETMAEATNDIEPVAEEETMAEAINDTEPVAGERKDENLFEFFRKVPKERAEERLSFLQEQLKNEEKMINSQHRKKGRARRYWNSEYEIDNISDELREAEDKLDTVMQQTDMIAYEKSGIGFFGRIRRMFRKDENKPKKGLFSSIRDAWVMSKYDRTDGRKEKLMEAEDNLYEAQMETEEKIAECKKRIAELKEERTKILKQMKMAGDIGLEELRDALKGEMLHQVRDPKMYERENSGPEMV